MPEKPKRVDDAAQPLYLEETVLDAPYLALTNASREALRMADLVDAMLRRLLQAVIRNDSEALKELALSGNALDRLQEAVKTYLTPHPSPHFISASLGMNTPAFDTASAKFSISGASLCSGMLGMRS